jgi:hypothetical protein
MLIAHHDHRRRAVAEQSRRDEIRNRQIIALNRE